MNPGMILPPPSPLSILILLLPNTRLRILSSITIKPCSYINARDRVSQPDSTVVNIIALDILIFKFCQLPKPGDRSNFNAHKTC